MKAYFRPANQPYVNCIKCDGRGRVYVMSDAPEIEGHKVRSVELRECDCENGLTPEVAQG
jgi:RecJ-like exonuclease